MKVIEVVVLLGAHCISPVENTAAVTEVSKVQCAVVIEKDIAAGTFRIIPAGASSTPEVVAVIERLDGQRTATRPSVAPPVATAPAIALPDLPKPEAKPPDPGNAQADAKPHKCRGEARPKWYTNAEGRRKYRCVLPG
jgi:hypothetical protein